MKENPESRYWKIGPIYVKKVFLLTVLAAGSIAAIGYFGLPTELLEKPPGETVYRFDDPALKDLSEPVRICDENNVIRYEGPVEKGVCTGFGRVYDETGALVYEGPLVEGRYKGKNCRLYRDGELLYFGEMRENTFTGDGVFYNHPRKEFYVGDFSNGLPFGSVGVYDLMGNYLGEREFSSKLTPEDFPPAPDETLSEDFLEGAPGPETSQPSESVQEHPMFEWLRGGIYNVLRILFP